MITNTAMVGCREMGQKQKPPRNQGDYGFLCHSDGAFQLTLTGPSRSCQSAILGMQALLQLPQRLPYLLQLSVRDAPPLPGPLAPPARRCAGRRYRVKRSQRGLRSPLVRLMKSCFMGPSWRMADGERRMAGGEGSVGGLRLSRDGSHWFVFNHRAKSSYYRECLPLVFGLLFHERSPVLAESSPTPVHTDLGFDTVLQCC